MCPVPGRRTFLSGLVLLLLGSSPSRSAADDKQSAEKGSTKGPPPRVYEPGGDVKPPKLIHYVEPEFSPQSKEAFVNGVVKITTVVTEDGMPTDLHVVAGLNAEADKSAIIAVKQWRFKPGTKSGEPVPVRMSVQVDFHLM